MKAQELNIDCEVFDDFREKLTGAINLVLDQLIAKGLSGGSVNAKIDIAIRQDTDTDTGEIIRMPEFEPKITMKIGAKGTVKCIKQEGMILKKALCGRNIVGSNQISMDELLASMDGDDRRKGA